jgi:hypothetical protein
LKKLNKYNFYFTPKIEIRYIKKFTNPPVYIFDPIENLNIIYKNVFARFNKINCFFRTKNNILRFILFII